MDFDNPKVYGDTAITDGLVFPKRAKNDVFFALNKVKNGPKRQYNGPKRVKNA